MVRMRSSSVKKKGLFFTIDALIAMSLVIGAILVVSKFYVIDPVTNEDYLGKDFIGVLANTKVDKINNSYLNSLIEEGNITNKNNTLLEQIGEFWANNKINLAQLMIKNVSSGLIDTKQGWGIWIDDDLVYLKQAPYNRQRSSYKYLISGIEKKKPIKGVVSRATAQLKSKITTKVIDFSTEGAGWYGNSADPGEVEITKYFEIPENSTILNATFYISLHNENSGDDWTLINFTEVESDKCVITKDEINFIGDDAVFDVKDVTPCIKGGNNKIKIKLRNPGYNAHIHPGMRIEIKYQNNITEAPYYSKHVNKTIFFDNIISKPSKNGCSGAWQTVPFYIPEDAENISIRLQVNTKNVFDYTKNGYFWSWDWLSKKKNYDYILFLNEKSPIDSESNPESNRIYIYNNAALINKITTGTNIVAVFLNNYGDACWGENNVSIYSDPINNPNNSSFIQLSYDKKTDLEYGVVEISDVVQLGGSAWKDLEGNFSFPEEAIKEGDVYFLLAQKYSGYPKVYAEVNSPASDKIFESKIPRVIPTKILVPDSNIELNPTIDNYIRAKDNGNNYILPESAIEYHFYIPISVPYGNLFNSSEAANNDALQRLNDSIGQFLDADLISSSTNITDVPTMWGPSTIELRVWE